MILLFSPQSQSGDCISCIVISSSAIVNLQKPIVDIEAVLNTVLDDQKKADEFLRSALNFLNQIKQSKRFNEAMGHAYIRRLKEIAAKTSFTPRMRARAYLIYAGIVGKIGEMRFNPKLGKEAYYALKNSMNTDPTFLDSTFAYFGAVEDMIQRDPISRTSIQTVLSVSLKDEARNAARIIEQNKWTERKDLKPKYIKFKSFR